MPHLAPLLLLVLFGLILFRVVRWINTIISNNELYKEDMLNVLEEIRDELKELNKNNLVK
ncbi:hypothetical protein SAMN05444396_10941 [Flavobacterium segetis]|uniref:Uncharacterized protein n=1 Tax=Flavobacterium segetis TaxID=271157 RepID=A0A1M5J202_9FLAO|nr:hypothetical protein SAMN05444396_10941 [Flavobacterium segetis]